MINNNNTPSPRSLGPPRSERESTQLLQKIVPKFHHMSICSGRILFMAFLLVKAACLGFASHAFLSDSEHDLAVSNFESICERALSTVRMSTERKLLGSQSMGIVAAQNDPDATAWPFVTIKGFAQVAHSFILTPSSRALMFAPLVKLSELEEFEDFAYRHIETHYPPNSGLHSFGKGVVWEDANGQQHLARNSTATSQKNHGKAQEQEETCFAPALQVECNDDAVYQRLMIDLYRTEPYSLMLDKVRDCARRRAQTGGENIECAAISSAYHTTSDSGPHSHMMVPIYPANNSTTLSGIIVSAIIWERIIEMIFNNQVSGIDCILDDGTSQYIFRVINGQPHYIGKGRLPRDNHLWDRKRTTRLTPAGTYSDFSPNYTLSLIPTDEFFDSYSTSNPTIATIGSVCIVLFTSLFFFLYDFCVRREFHENQAVLEAKRQFIRFVSHEVRTPLNSVCMGLKVLSDDVSALAKPKEITMNATISKDDSAAKDQADAGDNKAKKCTEILDLTNQILSSAKCAVGVLNDLLNYDKIESGQLKLELTSVAMQSLLKMVADEFELPFRAKSINLTLDLHDEDRLASTHRVIGDSVRLCQVMRNLLSNALKFTPEQGLVTLKARWYHDDDGNAIKRWDELRLSNSDEDGLSFQRAGHIRVDVCDTGAGMTGDQLGRLFSRGVQFNVNQLQAGQGSGLGLYIAKGIILQHGGELTAASDGLGTGSTFSVSLPLYNVPDANESGDEEKGRFRGMPNVKGAGKTLLPDRDTTTSTSTRSGIDSLRLLVVDDALMNRKMLSRLLQKRGHVCDQAEDGSEALEMVRENMAKGGGSGYDTILMDFEMPVMDGPTAAEKIRELGCQSPIVGITGNVLPEDVIAFKRKGANAVLAKPLDIGLLEAFWYESGIHRNEN